MVRCLETIGGKRVGIPIGARSTLSGTSLLSSSLDELLRDLDVPPAAYDEGNALVEVRRLDVENPLHPGARRPPRMLDDKGKGIRLVEEP